MNSVKVAVLPRGEGLYEVALEVYNLAVAFLDFGDYLSSDVFESFF